MITEIQIEVAGDQWMNREIMVQDIQRARGADQLIFNVNSEGASLRALGIVDEILKNISDIGVSPDRVWIDRWHNMVEEIPFHRRYRPKISHFFWMCENYRAAPRLSFPDRYPMAFFVGRLTVERSVMLWHITQQWPSQFLISLMRQSGALPDPEAISVPGVPIASPLNFSLRHLVPPWIETDQAPDLLSWIHKPPFASLTGHEVRDQYVAGNNTNRDLVAHYDRFAIELVAETYCLGDTFFPTEKTVRPISQGKPILVYGPKRFLARLKEMGFQTWGDIWDESYDELEGADRWQAMQPVLTHILDQRLWDHDLVRSISEVNKAVLDYLITKHRPG